MLRPSMPISLQSRLESQKEVASELSETTVEDEALLLKAPVAPFSGRLGGGELQRPANRVGARHLRGSPRAWEGLFWVPGPSTGGEDLYPVQHPHACGLEVVSE